MHGKIYVAKLKKCEKRPRISDTNTIYVNLTSMQGTDHPDRSLFSPMSPALHWPFPTDNLFKRSCMEHWWQSGKVFDGPDTRAAELGWWYKQSNAKRRHPSLKTRKVKHARFDHLDNTRWPVPLGYIDSRKLFYVPVYRETVEAKLAAAKTNRLHELAAELKAGKNVVLFDVDALPGDPLEFSLDLYERQLHDEHHPFGHGFVVARMLFEVLHA